MLRDVIGVRVLHDYVLEIEFDDGTRRLVDLEPLLRGPVFACVREPGYFRQVRVVPEIGTIAWPNGADIDPEYLYGQGRSVD